MSGKIKYERNEFGEFEGYDENGEMVTIQKPKKKKKEAREKGLPIRYSQAKEVIGSGKGYPYSRIKADKIVTLVTEGWTLSKIERDLKKEGFPPRWAIYRWLNSQPGFKAKYEMAKKTRAETFADTAVDIALQTKSDEDVKAAKLQIDTLKWAAGVGNPSEYNPRPKEEKQANIFVINTGIQREESKPIEVAHRKLDDEDR